MNEWMRKKLSKQERKIEITNIQYYNQWMIKKEEKKEEVCGGRRRVISMKKAKFIIIV